MRAFCTALLGAFVGLSTLPAEVLGQAFVEQVFPPVAQRGKTNRLRFTGTQIAQTLGVWTSVPGVSVKATPADSGDGASVAVDLDVPAEAPLGLYGLRLSTRSGLSNACLFLIDELPVTTANDAKAAVRPLTLPACVASPVKRAAVDRYSFSAAAGQRLTFEVIGNRLGKDFDPLVTLRDSENRILAQGDNDVGLFFDCRFEHRFAAAGAYFLEVSDARYLGDPNWNYVLRVGDFPVARTAIPSALPVGETVDLLFPQIPGVHVPARLPARISRGMFWHELRLKPDAPATWIPVEATSRPNVVEAEPNDSPADASPAYFPATWHGVLSRPGDDDWFLVELTKGQAIRVRGEAQRFGSAADLELAFFEPSNEPNGREVVRVDETATRDDVRNTSFVTEASFTFTARADGPHLLLVRDLTGAGGSAFSYRLEVTENTPELTLKAETPNLTVPKGTYQPLPLKVARTGFSGPIELTLVGAPAGVTLSPTTIPDGATEIVCQLAAEPSAAEGIGTIQVVGRFVNEKIAIDAVATAHPLIDRQVRNKDRILFAMRADQRELPPSLTDRIALQITPPAPFDIELPDQLVLLPKYQSAGFRIVTKRQPGFGSPITFDVDGGQIGEEKEERVQIYGRIPVAEAASPEVTGTLFNRILTRYEKHRVDLTAIAPYEGHDVSITRTFTLDIKSAFDPKFEPASVELSPGEKAKVKIAANRVATFAGAVELAVQNPPAFFQLPATIPIPEGKPEVEWEVNVPANAPPGRYDLRFETTGYVGKFQELLRTPVLTVNVKKPPEPKK